MKEVGMGEELITPALAVGIGHTTTILTTHYPTQVR